METAPLDLIVVGGGAAGFFAAIHAAAAAARRGVGCRILMLEKGHAPLGKVRVSGGGRCNVTHACFDPARLVTYYPRGGKALRGAFTRFQPSDTASWFADHGVALKTEADGRMFPTSDSSETIVACLRQEADRLGIALRLQAPVTAILPTPAGYQVVIQGRSDQAAPESYAARCVLLTTGGDRQAYALAEGLGHTILPPVPSLFTFSIPDPRLQGLAGISVDPTRLRLPECALEQSGPLLVTHWGLSGPAVLKLSAWGARDLFAAHYQASLLVNWLPAYHPDSLYHALAELRASLTRQKVVSGSPAFNPGPLPSPRRADTRHPAGAQPAQGLPQRLWERLALAAGIGETQTWGEVSRLQLNRLAAELGRGQFVIQGKGAFKEEFVTCGGVRLDEVNFKTMESRLHPGLYFAGEVLDIDGLTGGFNFQSAWTTGWLAGQAIGRS